MRRLFYVKPSEGKDKPGASADGIDYYYAIQFPAGNSRALGAFYSRVFSNTAGHPHSLDGVYDDDNGSLLIPAKSVLKSTTSSSVNIRNTSTPFSAMSTSTASTPSNSFSSVLSEEKNQRVASITENTTVSVAAPNAPHDNPQFWVGTLKKIATELKWARSDLNPNEDLDYRIGLFTSAVLGCFLKVLQGGDLNQILKEAKEDKKKCADLIKSGAFTEVYDKWGMYMDLSEKGINAKTFDKLYQILTEYLHIPLQKAKRKNYNNGLTADTFFCFAKRSYCFSHKIL